MTAHYSVSPPPHHVTVALRDRSGGAVEVVVSCGEDSQVIAIIGDGLILLPHLDALKAERIGLAMDGYTIHAQAAGEKT